MWDVQETQSVGSSGVHRPEGWEGPEAGLEWVIAPRYSKVAPSAPWSVWGGWQPLQEHPSPALL